MEKNQTELPTLKVMLTNTTAEHMVLNTVELIASGETSNQALNNIRELVKIITTLRKIYISITNRQGGGWIYA